MEDLPLKRVLISNAGLLRRYHKFLQLYAQVHVRHSSCLRALNTLRKLNTEHKLILEGVWAGLIIYEYEDTITCYTYISYIVYHTCICICVYTRACTYSYVLLINEGGREIAQSLESLSTKRAIRVRARLDLLVLERWNSITVLLTCSHQCRRLVKKGSPCVIMSMLQCV